MREKNNYNFYYFLLMITLLLIFNCCKTTDWAHECATRYPQINDTIQTQINTVLLDTVYVEKIVQVQKIITVKCPPNTDTVVVTKQILLDCPSEIVHEKIIVKHDSVFIRIVDRAKEAELIEQIKIDNSKGGVALRWKNIFLGVGLAEFLLLLLAVGAVVYIIRRNRA